MKCLLRMAVSKNQSMVFFETVLSLRMQKHTFIEAVPIPNDVFPQVPGYFYVALSEVESEWSDHKQVIGFSEQRPFQSSMVSRLPYFMIQWDYKGQRGYGHVIESRQDEWGRFAPSGRDEPVYDDGDHVGGTGFPAYVYKPFLRTDTLTLPTPLFSNFAHEIIGNMLQLEPQRWRKPKHVAGMRQLVDQFKASWDAFDWTR